MHHEVTITCYYLSNNFNNLSFRPNNLFSVEVYLSILLNKDVRNYSQTQIKELLQNCQKSVINITDTRKFQHSHHEYTHCEELIESIDSGKPTDTR